MDEALVPPGQRWTGVSLQLRRMRRFLLVSVGAVVTAGATIVGAAIVGGWLGGLLVVAGAGVVVTAWVGIGRNFASWGYAERADDLLVTHGVLFRQLVVVPYGRMQFVDVTVGPLERRFGIATVQLHTAAAATDARIPGVPPTEASRLRDRLAALGEARSAGL